MKTNDSQKNCVSYKYADWKSMQISKEKIREGRMVLRYEDDCEFYVRVYNGAHQNIENYEISIKQSEL